MITAQYETIQPITSRLTIRKKCNFHYIHYSGQPFKLIPLSLFTSIIEPCLWPSAGFCSPNGIQFYKYSKSEGVVDIFRPMWESNLLIYFLHPSH